MSKLSQAVQTVYRTLNSVEQEGTAVSSSDFAAQSEPGLAQLQASLRSLLMKSLLYGFCFVPGSLKMCCKDLLTCVAVCKRCAVYVGLKRKHGGYCHGHGCHLVSGTCILSVPLLTMFGY